MITKIVNLMTVPLIQVTLTRMDYDLRSDDRELFALLTRRKEARGGPKIRPRELLFWGLSFQGCTTALLRWIAHACYVYHVK